MEPVLWNRLHFLYRSGKIVRMDTSIDISHIRNFSIVAHIDHGKSTISDRILELTHTVDERDMESQLLDTMDIERERGITIKSNAVRVSYDADDGETYQFNLIDTPGHVDFTYEVSRSLAACEGAVLVVDATQGVEAQTVSNATLAMNANLDIVPAINKIDLPSAHPDEVKTEIEDDLAIPADDAVCVSGKTGEGIHDLLESIVFLISPPKGDANAPLKALILDSYFDEYRGVVATVRVFDGSIKKGDTLLMMQAKGDFLVDGVGVKRPAETPVDALTVGEVGYVVTGLKDPEAVRVGDTLTWASNPCPEPLPGYREAKPMVYTGLFPIDNKDYENLRDALDKLHVNDPSLVWEPETSVALGFGFRVGFLGLLHMEVVKERLEREFNLDLIATSPSVDYHVYKTDGEMIDVRSPQDLPEATRIERIEEPYLKAKIICPPEYTGAVMQLAIEHRGITTDMIHLTSKSVEMRFDMPLAELILDFLTSSRAAPRVTPRSTTSSTNIAPPSSSSSISCFRATRWMRFRLSCTRTRPMAWPAVCATSSRKSFRVSCSRCLFRAPSVTRSSPALPSRRAARTCWPSAMAAISRVSASCSRSRKRAKKAHEGHRLGRGPAGGLYGDSQGGRVGSWRFLNTVSGCWAPMPSSRSLWLPWPA